MRHSATFRKQYLPIFESEIAKLNKKCHKIGISEFTWSVVKEAERKITCNPITGVKYSYPYKVKEVEIEVEGETPKYEGWSFLARIEVLGEDFLITTTPGEEVDTSLVTEPSKCDHCGHNRFRRKTYLVRHDESGQIMQVGSSCLKDFLGDEKIQKILRHLEILHRIIRIGSDEESWGNFSGARGYYFEEIIPWAAFTMRTKSGGWYVSNKKVNDEFEKGNEIESTAAQAFNEMNMSEQERARYGYYEKPIEEDFAMIEPVLEFGKTLDPNSSSWCHNILVMIKNCFIPERHFNLAVSLAGVYFNNLRKEEIKKKKEEEAEKSPSEYFGEIKKRYDLNPIYKKTFQFEDYSGFNAVRYMHQFEDENGNVLVWWTGNDIPVNIEEGEKISLRGTVKAHNEFRGIKQTVLTRCQVK